jgi:leucyl/phenylalanyl-tRNA--protein transferase
MSGSRRVSRAQFVEALLGAYRQGAFPMGDPDSGEVHWYSPDPRAVLPLNEGFHVPRRLERTMRAAPFEIRFNTRFTDVVRRCAEPRPGREDSWINDWIISAYTVLHEAGHAHCVEAWTRGDEPRLVGGLYGVSLGGAFFAESKFSRPEEGGRDASKVCLVHLVQHLHTRGFTLLDVQLYNPHLEQFGLRLLSRDEYLARMREAIGLDVTWS